MLTRADLYLYYREGIMHRVYTGEDVNKRSCAAFTDATRDKDVMVAVLYIDGAFENSYQRI